jgi:hypothetical protein
MTRPTPIIAGIVVSLSLLLAAVYLGGWEAALIVMLIGILVWAKILW